jgi:formate hydrogenlyase subunit 3/multisubunit Na+/H+ antiporter MnhD subunit
MSKRYAFAMKSLLERVLSNRWIAAISAVVIGYISIRVFAFVAEDGYYNYYLYPRLKGTEYIFPELRYTFGQIAILVWSVVGICAAVFLVKDFASKGQHRWTVPLVIGFALGVVLLVVGSVIGAALRGVILLLLR